MAKEYASSPVLQAADQTRICLACVFLPAFITMSEMKWFRNQSKCLFVRKKNDSCVVTTFKKCFCSLWPLMDVRNLKYAPKQVGFGL